MSTLKRASSLFVIPERWFEMSNGNTNTDPDAVMGWCDICGHVPPIQCANGYMRRECEHSRDQRYKARNEPSVQPISNRCYTWLGTVAGDLAGKNFDNFYPKAQPNSTAFTKHLATCRMYAGQLVLKQPVGNLLMVGGCGTGKTHLAAAILNHLRQNGLSCLFCTARRLLSTPFDEQRSVIEQASSTPLLVYDDIDKVYVKEETGGAYQKGILHEILEERYLRKLPTIITTNESESLAKWLDGAAMSRLSEHLTPLVMQGVDYRARRK